MMQVHRLMQEHSTGVATSVGPRGMSSTLAYCSCKWQQSFRTRAEAQQAADDHTLKDACHALPARDA